ncbi:MAG: SLBB domain-containing protein [Candidatus Eisenbacteria bacterium]|nr:SLBB domain-containing protein [Candidatus Eisenbacteria bacterium]
MSRAARRPVLAVTLAVATLLAAAALAPDPAASQGAAEIRAGQPGTPPTTPGSQPPLGQPAQAGTGQPMGAGPAGTIPSLVTAPVDPDVYVVGPGDLFQLTLSGRVSRTDYLTVGPEGDLLIPGSGPFHLAGLTLKDARARLLKWLSGEFLGVRIDLQLARVRLMRVYVTGDVRQPGPIEIAATSRLSEALPTGVLLPGASRRNVGLRHRDGATLIGDLELFDRTGRYSLNPYLSDGDIIHVPTAVEFVEAHGAVAREGRFELGPADSLRTLLDLAGGPLPSAQADQCLLVRWRTTSQAESTRFDLPDVYSGRTNPVLRDGDHAFIFFTARFHALEHASIYGEIENPGVYPLSTGQTRLSDLIKAAHGFLPRADLASVRVFRASKAGAESDPEFDRLIRLSRTEMTDTEYEILRAKLAARREDYRVDWFRVEKAPELDILLRDDDVVRVDPLFASVRVEGEVRRPGIIEFEARRSVDEYVGLAGGFSDRAARTQIRITRAVTGQSLRARDVQAIAPGDLIWVPERPDVTLWQHLQTLIAVTAQVATVIIAVRR